MTDKPLFIYLHGFASSPASSKARYFDEHLRDENARVKIPDLNGGDFQQLTLTNQLQIIDDKFSNDKVVMIGSSMGGLLAVLKSNDQLRASQVAALILMAPGFGLNKRWPDLFGENTLVDWKEKGSLSVYHHGAGDYLQLGFQFMEDIEHYKTDELKVNVPTLVFHGKNDATVPIVESEVFDRMNSDYVEFHALDDDHQLLASLDYIWQHSKDFLRRLGLL